ncbi:MAG: dTMP kinase [Bacteroidales bacterium]
MTFLNIEGLDGSGKSTQIKLLIEYFQKKNIPYKYLHFPRTDSPIYGELIAKFLRGELGNMEEINPYLIALIYAGDRNDAKFLIQKWKDENYLVLIDRYVFSNIAFQCAKLENAEEIDKLSNWIKHLEYDYYKLPKPDISLFLDAPIEFIRSNLANKRTGEDRQYLEGKEDIHEKDINFQKKVRAIYLQEVNKENYFYSISCYDEMNQIMPPQVTMNKILKFIGMEIQ